MPAAPPRVKRLTRIARVDGVDFYFHWSTLLIGGLLLLCGIRVLFDALALLAGYWGVLLVHEWGHVTAARRRHCAAYAIEVYPIHGLTRISAPASRFDAGVIAWGGVLAQAAIAIPLVVWVTATGFVKSGPTNALLLMLGPFSLLIAAVNLVPASNMDGVNAWPLIPMLLARLLGRAVKLREQDASRRRRPRKKNWVQ